MPIAPPENGGGLVPTPSPSNPVNTFFARRGTSTEWTTAQNATAINITAISYAAGVITYTATNSLTAGQYVTIIGATSWQYNGTFQVATSSASQFTVNWTLASAGTTSTATAYTPILDKGEIGYETDSGLYKIGDGQRSWDYLPYHNKHKTIGVIRYPANSYFYNMNSGGTSSVSHPITTSNGYFSPIEIPSTTKISAISVFRTAGGSTTNLALGIYNHNYTTGLPDTLRHNAGPTSIAAPSVTTKYNIETKENNLTYITLRPGIYWVCVASVDSSITLLACNTKNFNTNSVLLTSTGSNNGSYTVTTTLSSGVLPATSPVVAGSTSIGTVDRLAFLVA